MIEETKYLEIDYEIYLITTPGYWYVGATIRRSTNRLAEPLAGRGNAPKLWGKIQELGKDFFHQVVVEQGIGNPITAEQNWYDFYFAHDARQTLNGARPGGRPNHTPESRAK